MPWRLGARIVRELLSYAAKTIRALACAFMVEEDREINKAACINLSGNI
jgi:hypothetical protein